MVESLFDITHINKLWNYQSLAQVRLQPGMTPSSVGDQRHPQGRPPAFKDSGNM